MNARTLSVAMTLTAVLLVDASAAWAGPHGRGKGPGHGRMLSPEMLERAADRLGLDDATLKSVKDQAYAAQKEMITLKADLQRARLDLRRMLDGEQPDRSQVMSQVDTVSKLQTALHKKRLGLMLDIRAMLTPDQVKQLKSMRGEMRSWKRQRRMERKRRRAERGQ